MKPLEVFALDKSFNRLTGSIPYTSLQWNRMYYEPGTFEIHVLSSVYSPDWAYIYCDDRPETGIIQKREYTDDQTTYNGDDTIRLIGFFTERWLYNYTFLIEDDVAEEYDYYIKHPPKLVWADDKPEVYKDGVGNVYTMVNGALYDTKGNRTNYSTDGMTKVEYELAPGIREIKVGGHTIGYRDVGYNYYTEDGKLYIVDASGLGSGDIEEVSYTNLIPLSVGYEGGNGNYLGALYSQGGKIYWVSQLVQNYENTWYRNAERWEEIVKNLDLEYVENPIGTSGIARRVRKVRGPYNKATALDEIGVPRDNVAAVVTWAQRMMGNSILYDEPDFEGETKVLDANLKNFGDFAFSELATIGASVRMFYSFLNNETVFQVWHGRDLTQRANLGEETQAIAATALSTTAVADPYPVPSGYTALEYVQSTGSQYVDLGVHPSSSTRAVLDHQLTDTSSVQALFGGRTSAGGSDTFDVYVVDGKIRTDFGAHSLTATDAVSSRVVLDKNGPSTTYGESVFTNNAATFTTASSLVLCSCKNASSSSANVDSNLVDTRGARMRVYSFKLYDDGALVRDMVPCRRDQDSQVGFYDDVSGAFYGNDGTGSFVAGPDIERPEPPEPAGERPWAVFSDTWGSMYGYTYTVDESNYRNTCYVMYDYDEPLDYNDDGRPVQTNRVDLDSDSEVDDWQEWGKDVGPHIPYKHKRGYAKVRLEDDKPDIECYLDLREQKPPFDGLWPRGVIQEEDIVDSDTGETKEALDWSTLDGLKQRYEGWRASLESSGREELNSKYPVERTLDTGTLSQDDYLSVWDLGDIVDMALSKMGVMQEARIVGVHEVHESGLSKVTVDLGEVQLAPQAEVTEE